MRKRQRTDGYSIVELLVVLGIVAAALIFVANMAGGAASGQQVEQAFSEQQMVKNAAHNWRRAPANAGSYTGITMSALSTNGYNVEPFTNGTNQNAYGMTVAIAAAGTPAGADATITYTTDDAADCQQMIQRWTNIAGVKGTPTCAAGVLTLTLE